MYLCTGLNNVLLINQISFFFFLEKVKSVTSSSKETYPLLMFILVYKKNVTNKFYYWLREIFRYQSISLLLIDGLTNLLSILKPVKSCHSQIVGFLTIKIQLCIMSKLKCNWEHVYGSPLIFFMPPSQIIKFKENLRINIDISFKKSFIF